MCITYSMENSEVEIRKTTLKQHSKNKVYVGKHRKKSGKTTKLLGQTHSFYKSTASVLFVNKFIFAFKIKKKIAKTTLDFILLILQ